MASVHFSENKPVQTENKKDTISGLELFVFALTLIAAVGMAYAGIGLHMEGHELIGKLLLLNAVLTILSAPFLARLSKLFADRIESIVEELRLWHHYNLQLAQDSRKQA